MLFHLSFLLWSYLRQEDKCVLYSFMSTKMEVLLQSELTECLVNARHWLLCMGTNLIGDICWGLGSPSLTGKTGQLQIVFDMWYVQFSSVAQSCPTLCNPMDCSTPGFCCSSPTPGAWANSCQSSWWFNPTISSCHPLLLLPSIFPSNRVFSNESVLHISWPKYWRFNFSIGSSKNIQD